MCIFKTQLTPQNHVPAQFHLSLQIHSPLPSALLCAEQASSSSSLWLVGANRDSSEKPEGRRERGEGIPSPRPPAFLP